MQLHLGCGTVFLKDYNNIDFYVKGKTKLLSQLDEKERVYFLDKLTTNLQNYYCKTIQNKIDNSTIICDGYDDIRTLKTCEKESFSKIVAFHLLEHFTRQDGIKALNVWISLLKNKGVLYLMVPDIKKICFRLDNGEYDQEWVNRLMFGSHKHNNFELHGHKSFWLKEMLISILKEFGLVCQELMSITDDRYNPSIYIKGVKVK